jgi:VWFA-related protein
MIVSLPHADVVGRFVVAVLILAGAFDSTAAQDPQTPQTFRGRVLLVPVDVRVLDRTGTPITDLSQQDFTVLENGRVQKISHFQTQALEARPVEGANPVRWADRNTPVVGQEHRTFLIVLGRGRLQAPAKGLDGALRLVRDRLLPQDRVAVVGWNRATDFTTDHEYVARVLERYKDKHERIEGRLQQQFAGLAAVYGGNKIPQAVQKEIDDVFQVAGGPEARTMLPGSFADADRLASDLRRTTDALQRAEVTAGRENIMSEADTVADLMAPGMSFDEFAATHRATLQDLGKLYAGIEYLRHLAGEKHLIFLSPEGLFLPRSEDDQGLAAQAADARVVIDIIHTGGVPQFVPVARGVAAPMGGRAGAPITMPGGRGGRGAMWNVATSRNVAVQTGGYFSGTSYAKDAMDRIDTASRFQYVLGYYPTNATLDNRFRRIAVRVNRPGAIVEYRRGYFARDALPPINRQAFMTYSRIAAAGGIPEPVNDLPLRLKATPATDEAGASEILIDLKVDANRVRWAEVEGRHEAALNIAMFCADGRQNLVGELWQNMSLKPLDALYQSFLVDGIPHTARVPVRAPVRFVKVVVYDYAGDRVGSAQVDLPEKR